MVTEHEAAEASSSTMSQPTTAVESVPKDDSSVATASRNGRKTRGFGASKRGRAHGSKWNNSDSKRKSSAPSDKRERNRDWRDHKRRKVNEDGTTESQTEASYMSIQFPKNEIAAEERRPKRKVAVLIGYAGTGYHGLQINHKDKTIEGDIFAALVAANAISKANADDPKKSSFVRCARTDKGVHAAGNMISLKLIIEDPDVVKKINDELPPQIRVWGIHRTNNAFSCYQSCDSRWYEYLMPSYCLLPPHHDSFLGKKVLESVKEKGVEGEYSKRLGSVEHYWEEVEKNDIQPILDSLDPGVREAVLKKIHAAESTSTDKAAASGDAENTSGGLAESNNASESANPASVTEQEQNVASGVSTGLAEGEEPAPVTAVADEADQNEPDTTVRPKEMHPVDRALKDIKLAYVAAKRRYRVTPERISRLQEALDRYVGTRNFHNYTIQKTHADPSSKRTIKSMTVNTTPVQINDTEWLSIKVHGQSFMMHQIRKMVGMAMLVARCGTPPSRIDESYSAARISIPKAPGLGLLLERPVFDVYNRRATDELNLEALDFGNYEHEIQEFKDNQIYRRIFELEENENSFHTFLHQIDSFKSDYFLWATAEGMEAAHKRLGPKESIPQELEEELGDEVDEDAGGGEG
ncbi:pseudouridine synthase [Xylariomycetidae sp. FL2044]|nr:pseudouridine synthase [Xylariomycetidae sp. FL2044]